MANPIAPILLTRLGELIARASRIAITCHKSPDGDAVGSSLALCRLLRNMGKVADVVTPDLIPRTLRFADTGHDIVTFSRQEMRGRFVFRNADLIIGLDFNRLMRIGNEEAIFSEASAPKVLIDHHIDPEDSFDVLISDPESSSTCELLYRILTQLGYKQFFDTEVARMLYMGMMTDTGNFTYNCDDPEIFEIVADLMTYGIDRARIFKLALNTFSEDAMRLQGYALSEKMIVDYEHGAALIALSQEELQRFNYQKGDSESLVNRPLCIPGIRMSVYLREDTELIKVSMRSEGDLSVNVLCEQHFGGGGHKNAAGGEYNGSLEDCANFILELFKTIN